MSGGFIDGGGRKWLRRFSEMIVRYLQVVGFADSRRATGPGVNDVTERCSPFRLPRGPQRMSQTRPRGKLGQL
jgi:hypothetical protein